MPRETPQHLTREQITQGIAHDAPTLEQSDWDAVEAGDLEVTDTPANGDIRFSEEKPGDLPGEDDDYQESDEALPDDAEERAIARNPAKEGGRFDEV